MAFNLSSRSKGKLEGVHPDMVAVVERAIQLTKKSINIELSSTNAIIT